MKTAPQAKPLAIPTICAYKGFHPAQTPQVKLQFVNLIRCLKRRPEGSFMLRLINILALAVFLLCFGMSNARADSTQYIVTGIFGPSTPTTAFSAPNSTFTITFTEPAIVPVTQVGPAAFSTNISVHYSTLDGVNQSFPAYDPSIFQGVGESFLNPSLTVGSNLDITYIDSANNIYSWSFDGAQLFSGPTSNPILIPGTFPVATGVIGSNLTCFIVSVGDNPCMDVYPLTSGSITATSEPGALALLSSGLLLLIALDRKSILTQLTILFIRIHRVPHALSSRVGGSWAESCCGALFTGYS